MTTTAPPRARGRRWPVLALAGLALAALLALPVSGTANANLPEGTPIADPAPGPNTDIRITGQGAGLNVTGFDGTAPAPTAPYPTTDPGGPTRTTFAGVLNTQSISDPSLTGQMYCINLQVQTQVGIGYERGTWEESNVPNIGWVSYILNNYYPDNPAAPALASPDEQAAAVQAAIWYFTDGFVVNSANPTLRAAVAAIVADAQTNGPLNPPPPPDVSITASGGAVPATQLSGPFTVSTSAATATLTVPAGYTMFADAGGTTSLGQQTTLPSGGQVWVGSDAQAEGTATITARAAVTVQQGEVYLYDGNAPGRTDAQRLILAATAQLDATAEAAAQFFAVGSLTVDKTFAGGAVGSQGAIQLVVDCGTGTTFPFDIPAGTTAAQTFTVDDIPIGNTCTVTEPVDGSTTEVAVTTTAPQSATVAAEGSTVTVANTVGLRPGTLTVSKVLAGPQAGLQGEITLAVDCGAALQETVVIPAGSARGTYTETFPDLPAGTACTTTETATGETDTVLVTTDAPADATIAPGATVDAAITNTVAYRPGDLLVTKVIDGARAGFQGDITLTIDCGAVLQDTFTIPAGSAAGSYERSYTALPAGTECTVGESVSGANSLVQVAADVPPAVSVQPGASVGATVTNTVTQRPAALPLLPATGADMGGTVPLSWIGGTAAAAGAALVLLALLVRRPRSATGRDHP